MGGQTVHACSGKTEMRQFTHTDWGIVGNNMRKQLLSTAAAVAITTAISGPGAAADRPVKAPPPPALWDWSGFYLGGHAGYGWSRHNAETSEGPDDPTAGRRRLHGLALGFQAGHNWQ